MDEGKGKDRAPLHAIESLGPRELDDLLPICVAFLFGCLVVDDFLHLGELLASHQRPVGAAIALAQGGPQLSDKKSSGLG